MADEHERIGPNVSIIDVPYQPVKLDSFKAHARAAKLDHGSGQWHGCVQKISKIIIIVFRLLFSLHLYFSALSAPTALPGAVGLLQSGALLRRFAEEGGVPLSACDLHLGLHRQSRHCWCEQPHL